MDGGRELILTFKKFCSFKPIVSQSDTNTPTQYLVKFHCCRPIYFLTPHSDHKPHHCDETTEILYFPPTNVTHTCPRLKTKNQRIASLYRENLPRVKVTVGLGEWGGGGEGVGFYARKHLTDKFANAW